MKIARILAAACFVTLTGAQAEEAPQSIRFEGRDWRVTAQSAYVGRHLGREALILAGGRVWLDDVEFSDGVIEFDVAFDERFGFIGPVLRAQADDRFEEIYFRTHLSGKPDAVQYSPVENGNSAWQIFSDAQTAVDLKYNAWNHLKIVVKGPAADFYFNSDTPQLHIPDLKTGIRSGRVGLRSSIGKDAEARFSNIVVRPLRPGERIIGTAKKAPALPGGLISTWRVSSAFAEARVAGVLNLPSGADRGLNWKTLEAESNGIANLSKLSTFDKDADTVFVRLKINSRKAQMKELRFGYSDRVRIYLNGKRVYEGNSSYRARDYRFLGTVGFFDSVGLDLGKGDNELLAAVSETFGGWAWAGAIEDQADIEIGR